MLKMIPKPEASSKLLVELRASIEAGIVTFALAQADAALKDRPMPDKITDLHHGERRKLEDAALVALMGLNRDAELHALLQAEVVAWDTFEQFCKDHGLDWCVDHPINQDDALEVLIEQIAQKAVARYKQTLCGTYPGLSEHLARLERIRATDTNPDLEAV